MSLAEKMGQMRQVAGTGQQQVELIRRGAVGALINVAANEPSCNQGQSIKNLALGGSK